MIIFSPSKVFHYTVLHLEIVFTATALIIYHSTAESSQQRGGPVTLASSVAVASSILIILLIGLVVIITVAVKWYRQSEVILHIYGDHLDIHESPSSATLHTYALKS